MPRMRAKNFALARYYLADDTMTYMAEESERMYPEETGGILVGTFSQDCVYVEHAVAPGPNAIHSPVGFQRDGIYSQNVLDELVAHSSKQVDYIGEWHSHPISSGPSHKDVKSMQWIANNEKYAIRYPIMGLCIREISGNWRMRFYLYFGSRLKELTDMGLRRDNK